MQHLSPNSLLEYFSNKSFALLGHVLMLNLRSDDCVHTMNPGEIEFRTLDYENDNETRTYFRTFWDIPLEHNEYFTHRSEAFLSEWIETARKPEERALTYAGIAIHAGTMVGLHILRRFEEWEQVGAHIAALWVHPAFRGIGIARTLKLRGEEWAKSVGATFLNTNVQRDNHRMLAINERAGFSVFRYNLRKRL